MALSGMSLIGVPIALFVMYVVHRKGFPQWMIGMTFLGGMTLIALTSVGLG